MKAHFYEKIEGWFNFKGIYERMVREAPQEGAKFVEVGCWKGKSAAFMAVEIDLSGKDIRFYCVDHWLGSPEHSGINGLENIHSAFLGNLQPVLHVITPMRMTSLEAAAVFEDGELDFVFIDAGHDYENVLADMRAWFPKVKPGGFIGGDDWPMVGVTNGVTGYLGIEVVEKGVELLGENGWYCWLYRKPLANTVSL